MKRVMSKTALLALIFGLLLGAAPLAAQQVAHPTPATPLSGRVDLRPQMKILEEWRQAEYKRLRASGKPTAADFKAVDDQFLSRARKAEGYRTDALNQLNKHSGVDVKQGAGGTQPQQGRGLAGDIDTNSLKARDFDKVKKTAERMGYKVTHQGDAITIEELNVTVHRESAAEAKMGSRTGSSAHGAEVRRGLNEETALGFKANNPNASVADNLKKAAHTLDTPAGKLSSDDVQKLGKMTGRNLDELAKLDPASAKKYETLQRQSDMLKRGYSPEAAGIEDLGKFQQEAREATVKAVKTTEKWAETRTADLTRQAQRAEEALTKARSSGDTASINQARQQLERTKTDLIGFKETQAAAKEAAVLNANNGKSATSVLAEAKGLNTTGKSPSMVREQILAADRNMISKTVNETPLAGGKATAGKAAAGEAASGMGSKLVKGGMAIMVIYGIVTGVKQGAEQAGEEADKKGDSTMVSILKTAGYSVWHGLGFGAAAETGKKVGEDSASQWAEDVKAGRVDPNSKLSRAWAQMRAVGWGLAEFTGLQAIKDAAVEGGGYVKDRYTQYKNEKQEAQQKKEVTDKKAEKEGKEKETKEGKEDPKDKANKEKADKEKAEKEKADKEKADKEKADREKAEKEKAEKERAEKEKAEKEKAEKERLEKAEKEKAEKEAQERRERAREKAEKERREAERQAREKAERQERERLEREKAEVAKKAAAAKAAQQPAVAPGTHEEVSGWATSAKGKTKLTYIKDASGKVLGGYYTHYDNKGREIGKEHFKNKPDDRSGDPPAGKESFNGSYSGRVSGGASGALSFTVRNGSLSGRISGNYQGDGAFATLSGTVDAAGNVRISAPGYVRGALGEKGKMENWEFEGAMTGKIRGKQASGSWTAKGFGSSRGSWSAAR